MFPLIFCSMCAQEFWCVRTFLEMTIFVQKPMKKFWRSNLVISGLTKKILVIQ